MKVVHIFTGLSYGGIETMLVNIANEQVILGLDVSVIIITNLIDEMLIRQFSASVTVYRIGKKVGSKNPFYIFRINKTLSRINPDIIHLHGSHIFNYLNKQWQAISCCTLHDVPTGSVGMSCRWGSIIEGVLSKGPGIVRCINRIPDVFSISGTVSDVLFQKYGVKSKVIYNGVPVDSFSKHSPTNGDFFKIVQISRLEHKKKGQDLLIEAIRILSLRKISNIEVSFVGAGSSEDYLKRMVADYGLECNFTFLGSKKQQWIMNHLSDFDLLVQPSRYEGFGLTVAEGMSAMVPVIVSAGQGPAEITQDERYGWLFESGNAQSLSRTIEYVINHKEEAANKSIDAYKYVRSTFNVKVTALNYAKEYKLIIKE